MCTQIKIPAGIKPIIGVGQTGYKRKTADTLNVLLAIDCCMFVFYIIAAAFAMKDSKSESLVIKVALTVLQRLKTDL